MYGKQQRPRYEPSFKKIRRLEQLNESIRAKRVPETSVKKLDLFPRHRHLHHSKRRPWLYSHDQIINFHPNQTDHPERGSHYQIRPLLYPFPNHLIHLNLWTHLRNWNNRKDKAAYVKNINTITEQKIKSTPHYNTGEVVCRVIPEQADKTITQSRKMKDLKILLNLKEINGKGVEDKKKKKKS